MQQSEINASPSPVGHAVRSLVVVVVVAAVVVVVVVVVVDDDHQHGHMLQPPWPRVTTD